MKKAPVSERALVARINRRLEKEGQKLCKTAPSARSSLGIFHIIDERLNTVEAWFLDYPALETKAREIGALKPHEELGEARS